MTEEPAPVVLTGQLVEHRECRKSLLIAVGALEDPGQERREALFGVTALDRVDHAKDVARVGVAHFDSTAGLHEIGELTEDRVKHEELHAGGQVEHLVRGEFVEAFGERAGDLIFDLAQPLEDVVLVDYVGNQACLPGHQKLRPPLDVLLFLLRHPREHMAQIVVFSARVRHARVRFVRRCDRVRHTAPGSLAPMPPVAKTARFQPEYSRSLASRPQRLSENRIPDGCYQIADLWHNDSRGVAW